jgi:NADPH2:quinone reductase
MRAIAYNRFGPAAEVLELVELDTPRPGPGEVLVALATSGVNPSDVKARAGARPGVTEPPYPLIIPHSDGAGTIEAVGEGVDLARVGERVWIWNGQWQRAHGTAATHIALPAEQAVRLPDGVSFESGAALGIPGLTATHAVLGGGSVAGRTVLVSGGAGTVGHLAVQIAKAAGARVLATAGGERGMAAARAAGADAVLDYAAPDLAEHVLEETGGAGVHRVVEVEFGANLATNTAVIAENGTIAAYGSMREPTPTLPFYTLMFKAVTIDLIVVYSLTAEQRARAVASLTDLLTRGALDIRIDAVMPLAECAAAHDRVAAPGRAGSVVLDTSGV